MGVKRVVAGINEELRNTLENKNEAIEKLYVELDNNSIIYLEYDHKKSRKEFLKECNDLLNKNKAKQEDIKLCHTNNKFFDKFNHVAEKTNEIEKNADATNQEYIETPHGKYKKNLYKLLLAYNITNETFIERGEEPYQVDIGNYLKNGDVIVFTRNKGARDIVSKLDYKEVVKDFKEAIIEAAIVSIGPNCNNSYGLNYITANAIERQYINPKYLMDLKKSIDLEFNEVCNGKSKCIYDILNMPHNLYEKKMKYLQASIYSETTANAIRFLDEYQKSLSHSKSEINENNSSNKLVEEPNYHEYNTDIYDSFYYDSSEYEEAKAPRK